MSDLSQGGNRNPVEESAQTAALGSCTAIDPASPSSVVAGKAAASHQSQHEAAGADRVTAIPKEIIQAATDLLTAAECSNTIVNNYGQAQANTQTLPTAAAGLTFLAVISTAGAGAFNIKAGASDKIYFDGTALDDGDKVSLATPAIGNCAGFFTFQTGATAWDWYCNTITGLWIDGGA
jgi:hypothetical protein